MKSVHSRETLCAIDCFPIEDEVLQVLVNRNGRSGQIYLTYQCICRYLNLFGSQYCFPTKCDVERILLTKKTVLDEDNYCYFLEDAEYNSSELLNELAYYCSWDYVSLTESQLEEAGLNLESEESLEIQIEKLEIFTDRTKQLLKKFTVNVESTLIDESGEIYVLWIRGVKEYRQYKKQNPKAIRQNFFREDQIICHILEYADDVMIWDNVTESYDIDGDEYLLSWITGSDGYNYVSIANLNPNWLISMYVLHGLLKHAQMLFGYEIGGRKEND